MRHNDDNAIYFDADDRYKVFHNAGIVQSNHIHGKVIRGQSHDDLRKATLDCLFRGELSSVLIRVLKARFVCFDFSNQQRNDEVR